MHFVSASIYHKATLLATQEGMDTSCLQHHDRIESLLTDANYLPMDLLFDVYEAAAQSLTPGFGLRQGKQLHADDYGTLGMAWKTCWIAHEVLDRVERFMVLVTDHGWIHIEHSRGMTSVYLNRDAHRPGVETSNEAAFVMLTNVLSEVTGKFIRPDRVQFKHTSKARAAFEEFFSCPVYFEQGVNAMHFKPSVLEVSTIKADKNIHNYLVERMQEEKSGIHAYTDHLLKASYQMILEALPSGIPSINQMAEHQGMSARTFKRRLSGKGWTFRALVQNIQQEVAVNLLRNSKQSMAEIAFQTGFSEQSAFNRAFKRWTGQSPLEFRNSA